MDGILVVNKPKGITSRDVVNKICKIFNTKKVGHTGTLDPIATGVLILCVGKATKLVEVLTSNDKEYIAEVKLGVLTDTLDTDGNILKEEECIITKQQLNEVLNSFEKEYEQTVPIYSAVRINGKKLYEYARNNEEINLPSRKVKIEEIELLDFNEDSYKFRVVVSKGTYIRSLIKDIANSINKVAVMSDLRRIKQGNFDINISNKIDDEYNIIPISEVLKDYYTVEMDEQLEKKILNGCIIDNIYNKEYVLFKNKDNLFLYKNENNKLKPFKMFL